MMKLRFFTLIGLFGICIISLSTCGGEDYTGLVRIANRSNVTIKQHFISDNKFQRDFNTTKAIPPGEDYVNPVEPNTYDVTVIIGSLRCDSPSFSVSAGQVRTVVFDGTRLYIYE